MGRNDACKRLSVKEENKKMEGIVFDSFGTRKIKGKDYDDLDEASGAYKDIDKVMEAQKDLVEIVVKLKPLGGIKG